jgi:hypothetical protein
MLTWRWTPLREHATQHRLAGSRARFKIVTAGRRSGKTEIEGKRMVVFRALNAHRQDLPALYCSSKDPRFFVAAPTCEQAKAIYWEDIKALIPTRFLWGRPNESTLTAQLINGARIRVLGLDKPARMEGVPWDGGVLDEYADMKPEVFPAHVEPCLAERKGWCSFIGVPEGRNHFYELYKMAQAIEVEALAKGEQPLWETFNWPSADILDPAEIERLRKTCDPVVFRQEYEGSFENFTGRAYYNFDDKIHCQKLEYNPHTQLVFCFDFNISPGTAVVCQEIHLPNGQIGTGVIGEVHIDRNSNTPMVLNRLLLDWKDHPGHIECFGDPAGASGGTMRMESDWELIRRMLYQRYGHWERFSFSVPKQAPKERDRVNAVNSRLMAADGSVRLMVDPTKAPHVVKDFENVVCVKGGSGELDKKHNPMYSHMTDALGYYIQHEFPLKNAYVRSEQKFWK